MKKIFALTLALIIVLLTFTGCDDPMAKYKDLPDTYHVETDFPIGFSPHTNSFHSITRSDTGYYVANGSMIYYADHGVMEPVPLCARPECRHGDTTEIMDAWKCDAYFMGCSAFLQYYEGSLYTIATGYSREDKLHLISGNHEPMLLRISLDGSTVEPLAIMEGWEDGRLKTFIHRGYLYTFPSLTFDGDGAKITRIPLHAPTSEPEVVLEVADDISINNSFFYGDHFYYSTTDSSNDFFGHVYDLDLNTMRTREIATDIEGDDRRLMLNGVYQGKPMITSYFFISGKGYDYCDLYLYDTESGKSEHVADLKPYLPTIGEALVFCDGESPMLYTDNGGRLTLTALDETFSPIGEPVSISGSDGLLYPGDDSYAFHQNRETFDWCFYDKSKGYQESLFMECAPGPDGYGYHTSDLVYVLVPTN